MCILMQFWESEGHRNIIQLMTVGARIETAGTCSPLFVHDGDLA